MPKIRFPRLTWSLDCEPLDYPGVVFTFWLNPPVDIIPETDPKGKEPWEKSAFHRNMALILESVLLPAKYVDGNEDVVVEIPDAKALWDLQHDEGFDPQLILWASGAYQDQRRERLRIEAKN